MTSVLVVEDEAATRQVLVDLLAHLGYDAVAAASGVRGLELAAATRPDLVVLDLGLPDVPGMEVIRRLRQWSDVPVLVVSGSTRHSRKADALDAGADDFLDKPFDVSELRARLRVAERRIALQDTDATVARTFDQLVIDPLQRSVLREGDEVRMTETEWLLLDQLSAQPGRVRTHRWLIKNVWGPRAGPEAMGPLRSHLRSVRAKIGDDAHEPRYIRTESGVGYRWVCQPSAVPASASDPLTLATVFCRELDRSLSAHGHAPDPTLRTITDELVARLGEIVGGAGDGSDSVSRGHEEQR